MRNARVVAVAGRQFNRISRQQLLRLGKTDKAIECSLRARELVAVEQGVFALAPLLEHDDWGKWMGATLTAPETFLSHESSAAAYGFWSLGRAFESVTRPGSGGPKRHGGILAYHSEVLD